MAKVAFLFPGQGAQYVGMGKDLYENFSTAKRTFEEADDILKDYISKICFNGPEDVLRETINTQPAILTHSIACYKTLREHGIKPDIVAGLSLGEYSALVAAGSMDFSDAVPLVRKRGTYIQEAVPIGRGGMAAIIGLKREQVTKICQKVANIGKVEATNFNCPGQIVLSGEVIALEKAIELAKEEGAKKTTMLSVSAPFHCSLLKPAGERLAKVLSEIEIKDTSIPLISNVTADFASNGSRIKELLIKQVSSPVLWEDSICKMIENHVDTFVEIGPGRTLVGFVKKIDRNLTTLNVEDIDSLKKTIKHFGG